MQYLVGSSGLLHPKNNKYGKNSGHILDTSILKTLNIIISRYILHSFILRTINMVKIGNKSFHYQKYQILINLSQSQSLGYSFFIIGQTVQNFRTNWEKTRISGPINTLILSRLQWYLY